MILWSIQHLNQLKEFEETKILKAYEEHIDKDFKKSYDWLITKMQHIDNPYNAEYPIWAWKNWLVDKAKPDLRSYRFSNENENWIRIEFEVDDKDVLVTDFDYWHSVLMNSYIYPTNESEEEWIDADWNDPKYKHTQEEITKSWDTLFNLGERASGNNQACVWHIHWDQVRNITHFKSKKKKK